MIWCIRSPASGRWAKYIYDSEKAQEATPITGALILQAPGDQHYQSHVSSIVSSLLLESIEITGWLSLGAAPVAVQDIRLSSPHLIAEGITTKIVISFPSGKCPEVELLDNIVIPR